MLRREAGAARVRRIVDKNGTGSFRDLALKVLQIDLPALVGQQVILVEFDVQILADWLAEWETWFRDENAIADFTEDGDGIVEGAGAAERQKDVIWLDRMLHSAELLSDGRARGYRTL